MEVPAGHVTFNSGETPHSLNSLRTWLKTIHPVADQFKTSWRHAGTSCPTVRKVYKILPTPTSLANYNAYR